MKSLNSNPAISIRKQRALFVTAAVCLWFTSTSAISAGSAKETARSVTPSVSSRDIVALRIDPPSLQLRSGESAQVLVTARTKDGFEVDVTKQVKLVDSRSGIASVNRSGQVRALKVGEDTLTADWGKEHAEARITVTAAPTNQPLTFTRDILPILSKAGCNAGACHAKGEGQNGFKLSVFSYDPANDYQEIVKDARGRRVFPAAPEESLLLLKPSLTIPHEGGLRLERGSESYRAVARWIREGMIYRGTNEATLERLTVLPKERSYRKGFVQPLIVQAHYSDGGVRDVTRLAAFDANDKEVARVDEHGVVSIGKLRGQAVVVARFMGMVGDSRITVPADRLLPEAQYASLPART